MKEPGHGTRQFNWHRNQFIKMLAFDPAVKRALGRKFYAYVEVLAILFGAIVPQQTVLSIKKKWAKAGFYDDYASLMSQCDFCKKHWNDAGVLNIA